MANVIPNGCNQEAIYVPAPDPCSGGCVLEQLIANRNGTFLPPSGKDGFSDAVVNVPNTYTAEDEGKVVSNGALVAQGSQTITENGTYDTTLISALTANISGGGGSAVKLMNQGQVSTTSAYATASFNPPFDPTDYDIIYIILWREGVKNGIYAISGKNLDDYPFSLVGDDMTYRLQFGLSGNIVNTIKGVAYSGSYVNLYVDVYGMNV